MTKRKWYKVRSISGKETLGYKEFNVSDSGEETPVDPVDANMMMLRAPFMFFINTSGQMQIVPENDPKALKDSYVMISMQALESIMPVDENSELVRAITAQLSGIVIARPDTSNIVDMKSKK